MIIYLSLSATIRKARPDLLTEETTNPNTKPIPEEMPPRFLEQFQQYNIEDIGEPTTACFFTKMPADTKNWYSSLPSMLRKYVPPC